MPSPLPTPDWSHFLGRPTPAPSPSLIAQAATHRRILITGAGGSLGSALARTLAPAPHSGLTLLDHSEQALYELHAEFSQAPNIQLLLGNCGDPALLTRLFRDHAPNLVLHTAAYKHVPLLESQPFAAVQNNLLHTQTLLQRSAPHAQLLLLSTDKAAAPHSIMGATKRVAELLTLAHTHSALRLVNILGSHGSVVPLFQSQLAAGTPLTVTTPTATRFWMTPEEAVTAILQAICIRHSGLFVPPVGPPQTVLSLARFLAAEAGLPTHPITFTGLRPGDKEHETLLAPDECWSTAPDPQATTLRELTTHPTPRVALSLHLHRLRQATASGHLDQLHTTLSHLCPTYIPATVTK